MSDALQRLIDAEQAAMRAAPGAKEATWSALEASVAAGAPAPVDLPPMAGALPIAWIAGLFGGASGLALIAYLATRPAIEAPPPPPPPPVVQIVPPPPPPPAATVEPPAKEPVRRPAPTRTTLATQIALLRKAQLAFARGGPDQALELVQEHRTKYPKTPLEQERSALEVLASCRMKTKDAKSLAQRFLREWPQSPQTDRVRQTCEI